MRDAINADAGDCGAFDGAQQYATQSGADGGTESTLERLRRKLTETLGKSFSIGD
jgi:hypothetical protein